MKQYKKTGKVKQTIRIPVPKPTRWHKPKKDKSIQDVDFCRLCQDQFSSECDECDFGV